MDEGRPISWRALTREAEQSLEAAGLPSAAVDARRIAEEASGCEAGELALVFGQPAPRRAVAAFDRMVARRMAGEPLQYVLGRWGFRTLDLLVDRRVLIPRSETEMVVERALVELDLLRSATGMRNLVAVDLGTGSGAIALSLAAEREWVDVVATDASTDALDVARANLAGLGSTGTRVAMAEGSWFGALHETMRGGVDIVISNPPYVATGDSLAGEVRDWEPPEALISGPEGTECHEVILRDAPVWLRVPGVVVLEISSPQAGAVSDIARSCGFRRVEVHPDLAGRDRILVAGLI